MSLQYLEALKSLGGSPSTKLLIPMELTGLLRPFLDHASRASESAQRAEPEGTAAHH